MTFPFRLTYWTSGSLRIEFAKTFETSPNSELRVCVCKLYLKTDMMTYRVQSWVESIDLLEFFADSEKLMRPSKKNPMVALQLRDLENSFLLKLIKVEKRFFWDMHFAQDCPDILRAYKYKPIPKEVIHPKGTWCDQPVHARICGMEIDEACINKLIRYLRKCHSLLKSET